VNNFSLIASLLYDKDLTRCRTDHFTTKNLANNQLEQQHSIKGIIPSRPPRELIGTLSLSPAFNCSNWFSQLYFTFTFQSIDCIHSR